MTPADHLTVERQLERQLADIGRRYALQHGASNRQADEIGDGITLAARRIARHVITDAGFNPQKWTDT